MSNTEEERHRLHRALESVIGEEEASTLMRNLPPDDWTEQATKRDLEDQDRLLRTELEQQDARLRTELERQDARLRTELEQQDARLRTELDHTTTLLRAEMQVMGSNLTATFHREMRRHTQFTIVANATIAGVFVALASLI